MKDEQIYGRLSIYLFISCSLQEQGGRLEKAGYLVHWMLKMSLMTLRVYCAKTKLRDIHETIMKNDLSNLPFQVHECF